MIAVIDYGLGNPKAVLNMIARAGAKAVLTSDPKMIAHASKLILPGVGAFDYGMSRLEELGLVEVLRHVGREHRRPLLGICLGAQLLTEGSEEGGRPGLALLPARTIRLASEGIRPELRVPHMGWAKVRPREGEALFAGIERPLRFYFAHSYRLQTDQTNLVAASVDYGVTFPAVLRYGETIAAQFHPEKSHRCGMAFLRNFAAEEPG